MSNSNGGAYESYKIATSNFLTWVNRTAGINSEKSTVLKLEETIISICSSRDYSHATGLSHALRSCDKAIKLRERIHFFFSQEANSTNDANVIESNTKHAYFLLCLKKWFKLLNEWQTDLRYFDFDKAPPDHVRSSSVPLTIEEDCVHIFDDLDGNSIHVKQKIEDNIPIKINTLSHLKEGIDPFEEDLRFELTCLIIDLEDLMETVLNAWKDLKLQHGTISTATSVTVVALKCVNAIAARLELTHPAFKTFGHIKDAGFLWVLPPKLTQHMGNEYSTMKAISSSAVLSSTSSPAAEEEKPSVQGLLVRDMIGVFELLQSLIPMVPQASDGLIFVNDNRYGQPYDESSSPLVDIPRDAHRFLMPELARLMNMMTEIKNEKPDLGLEEHSIASLLLRQIRDFMDTRECPLTLVFTLTCWMKIVMVLQGGRFLSRTVLLAQISVRSLFQTMRIAAAQFVALTEQNLLYGRTLESIIDSLGYLQSNLTLTFRVNPLLAGCVQLDFLFSAMDLGIHVMNNTYHMRGYLQLYGALRDCGLLTPTPFVETLMKSFDKNPVPTVMGMYVQSYLRGKSSTRSRSTSQGMGCAYSGGNGSGKGGAGGAGGKTGRLQDGKHDSSESDPCQISLLYSVLVEENLSLLGGTCNSDAELLESVAKLAAVEQLESRTLLLNYLVLTELFESTFDALLVLLQRTAIYQRELSKRPPDIPLAIFQRQVVESSVMSAVMPWLDELVHAKLLPVSANADDTTFPGGSSMSISSSSSSSSSGSSSSSSSINGGGNSSSSISSSNSSYCSSSINDGGGGSRDISDVDGDKSDSSGAPISTYTGAAAGSDGEQKEEDCCTSPHILQLADTIISTSSSSSNSSSNINSSTNNDASSGSRVAATGVGWEGVHLRQQRNLAAEAASEQQPTGIFLSPTSTSLNSSKVVAEPKSFAQGKHEVLLLKLTKCKTTADQFQVILDRALAVPQLYHISPAVPSYELEFGASPLPPVVGSMIQPVAPVCMDFLPSQQQQLGTCKKKITTSCNTNSTSTSSGTSSNSTSSGTSSNSTSSGTSSNSTSSGTSSNSPIIRSSSEYVHPINDCEEATILEECLQILESTSSPIDHAKLSTLKNLIRHCPQILWLRHDTEINSDPPKRHTSMLRYSTILQYAAAGPCADEIFLLWLIGMGAIEPSPHPAATEDEGAGATMRTAVGRKSNTVSSPKTAEVGSSTSTTLTGTAATTPSSPSINQSLHNLNPIHAALLAGRMGTLQILLEADGCKNISCRTEQGDTLMHLAVRRNFGRAMAYLFRHMPMLFTETNYQGQHIWDISPDEGCGDSVLRKVKALNLMQGSDVNLGTFRLEQKKKSEAEAARAKVELRDAFYEEMAHGENSSPAQRGRGSGGGGGSSGSGSGNAGAGGAATVGGGSSGGGSGSKKPKKGKAKKRVKEYLEAAIQRADNSHPGESGPPNSASVGGVEVTVIAEEVLVAGSESECGKIDSSTECVKLSAEDIETEIASLQRRLKNLRKKVRDINTLEAKLDIETHTHSPAVPLTRAAATIWILTDEQRDKICRKADIEQEIRDVEDRLLLLERCKPIHLTTSNKAQREGKLSDDGGGGEEEGVAERHHSEEARTEPSRHLSDLAESHLVRIPGGNSTLKLLQSAEADSENSSQSSTLTWSIPPLPPHPPASPSVNISYAHQAAYNRVIDSDRDTGATVPSRSTCVATGGGKSKVRQTGQASESSSILEVQEAVRELLPHTNSSSLHSCECEGLVPALPRQPLFVPATASSSLDSFEFSAAVSEPIPIQFGSNSTAVKSAEAVAAVAAVEGLGTEATVSELRKTLMESERRNKELEIQVAFLTSELQISREELTRLRIIKVASGAVP